MTHATWLAVALDRRERDPLQVQLYAAIRGRIVSGLAQPGAALPPSRAFAAELVVSRSTVIGAYEQLTAEGYVHGRRGAGVFVSPLPDAQLTVGAPSGALAGTSAGAEPSSIRPFRPGAPDLRLFPHLTWSRMLARAWKAEGATLWADDDPLGSLGLRRAIAGHLAEWRGVRVDPDGIVITAGAAGALELALDAFTVVGDRVAIENPGYPLLPNLVRSRNRVVGAAAVDREGISLESLKAMGPVRMVIATPSHQFPLGGALSIGRRQELLRWTEQCGAIVVEDDYDSEFRYTGRPLPALAAIGGAPVLYVGTLSKVFWTGLRIGFLAAPPSLAGPLREAAARLGPKASVLPQAPLAEFIDSGEFARHLRRMRRIYGERLRSLRSLISELFGPDLMIADERAAGMHLLARLGPGLAGRMSADEAAARAQAVGVSIAPLSRYYSAPPVQEGLILGFAAYTEPEMRQAALCLRQALAR